MINICLLYFIVIRIIPVFVSGGSSIYRESSCEIECFKHWTFPGRTSVPSGDISIEELQKHNTKVSLGAGFLRGGPRA